MTYGNSNSQHSRKPAENLISNDEWGPLKSALGLTNREADVARLLFEGHKRAVVARQLGIETRTVRQHMENIHKKLAVNDRVGVVLRLIQIRDELRAAVPRPNGHE